MKKLMCWFLSFKYGTVLQNSVNIATIIGVCIALYTSCSSKDDAKNALNAAHANTGALIELRTTLNLDATNALEVAKENTRALVDLRNIVNQLSISTERISIGTNKSAKATEKMALNSTKQAEAWIYNNKLAVNVNMPNIFNRPISFDIDVQFANNKLSINAQTQNGGQSPANILSYFEDVGFWDVLPVNLDYRNKRNEYNRLPAHSSFNTWVNVKADIIPSIREDFFKKKKKIYYYSKIDFVNLLDNQKYTLTTCQFWDYDRREWVLCEKFNDLITISEKELKN